jgi:hypothetical protein
MSRVQSQNEKSEPSFFPIVEEVMEGCLGSGAREADDDDEEGKEKEQ